MAAPTLQSKQKKIASVSNAKKILRNVLCAPVDKIWPLIADEDEHVLLDTINTVITALNINKLNQIKYPEELTTRKEKNEFKKKTRSEHWAKGKEARSWLVFGINEVTKCLEKDELSAVLVARDVSPAMMTQHLISLCTIRNVIAASIRGLKKTMNDVLNFKSCLALGLKKGVEDPSNSFHEIYSVLSSIKKPLPDLQLKLPVKPEIPVTKTSELTKTSQSRVTEQTPIDFSQFYVLKSQEKFIPKSTTKSDDGFLKLSDEPEVDKTYKTANIKQTESISKPKKKKRKV